MLDLFFAMAFSAAPLTLYIPPIRSLNLFIHAIQEFLRDAHFHASAIYLRLRLASSRFLDRISR